jgi:pectate lyase
MRYPYRFRFGTVIVLVLVALFLPDSGESQVTYQGFGTTTRGGSGGTIVRVTNLHDSGPGSLREAVSQGNRTVVFQVAGEIRLSTYLYVLGANIAIDGFTAPAPGITVKNYGLIIRGNKGAHAVIVRGIRIRNAAINGLQVAYGAYNVVIEHASVAVRWTGTLNITESSHDRRGVLENHGGDATNMLVEYNSNVSPCITCLRGESTPESPALD